VPRFSIRMSEGVPEQPESVYAREGTAAHALAECMARDLLLGEDPESSLDDWRDEFDITDEAEAEMEEHAWPTSTS
jgi:hypothetical protein